MKPHDIERRPSDRPASTSTARATVVDELSETPLQQRLHTIVEACDVAGERQAETCVGFIEQLQRLKMRGERAALLLYQLYLARLPTPTEAISYIKYFENEAATALADRFMASVEFAKGAQSSTYLETIPSESLVVDVTHTLDYPYNTGIQRVVRSIGKQFAELQVDHCLVRFDERRNVYMRISEVRASNLRDWEHRKGLVAPPASCLPASRQPKTWKRRLRRIAGERLSNAIRDALRAWKQRRRANRPAPATEFVPCAVPSLSAPESVLFLWNNQMLFPELIGETSRLQAVCSLLQYAPLTTTMILYDLIPLIHPEFCAGIVDPFVRYLTLLRNVDRVSCISRSVQADLERFMVHVDRRGSTISIASHHLGGDFDFSITETDKANVELLPTVLCVGTWEVRKNHRRILRAMVKAQQAGGRFKGVFAGNPGWLSEAFFEELEYFQARGFQVELRQSVTEAELSKLYKQASFSIYCSLAEGFGLPIVESIAKGVPCITSNRGSMNELAGMLGGCLVVDPEAEDAMANAILSLINEPRTLDTLRDQARHSRCTTWSEYASDLFAFATSREHCKSENALVHAAA